MRRLFVLCACLATVGGAATLATAAAAAAEAPEWYECVKQTGGAYEKGCATEGGKGGYIARPGIGANPVLTATSGKVVISGGTRAVDCGSVKTTGRIAMPNRLEDVHLTFHTCYENGDTVGECYTEEAQPKTKELVSEELQGRLGYISRSPLKVGIVLSPVGSDQIMSRFHCQGQIFFHERWYGSLTGQVLGPVNDYSKKVDFEYTPGAYDESEPETLMDPFLEGETPGAFEVEGGGTPNYLQGLIKLTKAALMIRA